MTHKQAHYQTIPFPKERQIVIDSVRLGKRKHTVYGLVEVDVTKARRAIREHKARTGETLSFTAFIIQCLGQAVDERRIVHAYRNWRNRLVLFDEVDIATLLEIELSGRSFPLAHIIRSANQRTFRDIHQEIRAIQADPYRSQSLDEQKRKFLRPLLSIPAFVRDIIYLAAARNPFWVKNNIGTVVLTAVGMFGQGGGWGIPTSIYTLGVTLGGIAEKPGVVDGRIEVREYLSLTLAFDHDIVDGAPAARFTQRLKELIESGFGLES
jgi:pyruvate/2-oxoglutarate dehydrogenase complex dihydrolipoamide acyltransferase (E2) component